jgi:hypothetical protein
LFWRTQEACENYEKKQQASYAKPFAIFMVALIYTLVHSLVLYYQATTLNVAINSHNGLLTLLVSNQFVELKGSVFKKFEKENLFQISCSGKKQFFFASLKCFFFIDMVERFQILVFLGIVTLQNCNDLEWSFTDDWVWTFRVRKIKNFFR